MQDQHKYIIDGNSPSACPELKLSKVWEQLKDFEIFFYILFFGSGLFFIIFGNLARSFTLILVGFFTGFGILIIIFGEFVTGPNTDTDIAHWMFGISIVIGVLFSFITYKI